MFPTNESGIGLITDTKLQNWLSEVKGSFENSSKVVDENGEPMVVYHGTRYDFNAFRFSNLENAFYFTVNPDYAKEVANATHIVPVFLDAKKLEQIDTVSDVHVSAWRRNNKDSDADGLSGIDANSKYISYVVFNPTQIKSATGNQGTYSGQTGDMRFQKDKTKENLLPFQGGELQLLKRGTVKGKTNI